MSRLSNWNTNSGYSLNSQSNIMGQPQYKPADQNQLAPMHAWQDSTMGKPNEINKPTNENSPLTASSRSTSTTTKTSSTVTTATVSVSLPIQCYTYSTLNEVYRNYQNGYGCCWSPYDTSPYITPGWYRFTGSAGSSILTTPVLTTSTCGTSYPGYFNGTLPSTVGASVTGTACFFTGTPCGYSLAPITAVNCNGYYIFYLLPVVNSNYRYCSTT
ncbi:unnamed protein product [Rotaria socialis]|uniref:Uncharacterized protein n=1 Tax=Rotaria socialis TaxID=392032 RepID=A0A820ES47_9BILA|nr:unnamed protein product [Rotaria socialis]CAF3410276.1 unnamed protein product [Rotaria socialis]CAF3419701.1 unnamed protein product [Rotaria socialis]CAF3780335.1 unnamed protein product [Rotaria socialis]CAF4250590.1 unnamed protein product [Rotaria socialis]